MGTWGQGVTVPWSHQAVREKRAKSNSWPTQRATHSLFLCSAAARDEHDFFYRHTFHTQTHVSCNCLSSYPQALCRSSAAHLCVLVALSRGAFLKLQRCSHFSSADFMWQVRSSGRDRVWAFIKAHESIRSCSAVGHMCTRALLPWRRIVPEREPASIRSRAGLAGIEAGCAMHGWASVTSLSSDKWGSYGRYCKSVSQMKLSKMYRWCRNGSLPH